jgi:hypothetical protein
MRFRPAVLCLSCVLLSSSCWAATLEPVQGSLYVNDGNGFQPVNGRIDVNVGERVMVSPGGTATIVYSDGCKIPVQPGTVTTITSASPCTSPFYRDQSFAEDTPSGSGQILGLTGAVLGAAGLGVGIYALTKHNSTTNNYISP